MLKMVKVVVALALGLIMSLSLLTSGSFALSVHQSTPHVAQVTQTAQLPSHTVQLTSLKSAAFGPRFGFGRFGGFRGGFGFHRGFFFRRPFFFHRHFFHRRFFFGGPVFLGGFGGCSWCGGCW